MPEKSHIILEEEHLAQLSKRETSSEIDDAEPKDIGELLGFRITGGRDFYMPITIFHVKESSRAEKANLKLGDTILCVNGRSTENMTLNEANSYLAKVSSGDVVMQIAKFDGSDDDGDIQNIEEVVLEGPASLEQKLRTMQKQLLEMTDIPVQIKSKLAMVTKALEQFITMDQEALETSWSSSVHEECTESEELNSEKQFSSIAEENDDIEVDITQSINEYDSESFDRLEETENSTRETSFTFEDLDEHYSKFINENGESIDAEKFIDDEEKSICDSLKSEDALKLEEERKKKLEKIQKLEKSWQKISSNQKTIHKRSNCHLVRSTALANNKINQLNESKVISFYERKRAPVSD